MKRRLAADEVKRRAIGARLSGMASRAIAERLGRSHDTIKGHLSRCGTTVEGSYHLNGAFARGLFTEHDLLALGAAWNGRCWVGRVFEAARRPRCNGRCLTIASRARKLQA